MGIAFNSKTNTISCEEDPQVECLVNTLIQNLLQLNVELPPSNVFNQTLSQPIQKLIKSGDSQLEKKKYNDAIKFYSTALEMALRRPIWEQTLPFMEEVGNCLMKRCKAYLDSKDNEAAYADATLLLLMRPMDATCFYYKAVCLISLELFEQAANLLQSAVNMKPGNDLYKAVLNATLDRLSEQREAK